MIRSSSPLESPPTSRQASSSVSSRKTYSRRASAHKEKRKAQALAASSDEDEDSYGDRLISSAASASRSARPTSHGGPSGLALAEGSPVSKKVRALDEENRQAEPEGSSAKLTRTRSGDTLEKAPAAGLPNIMTEAASIAQSVSDIPRQEESSSFAMTARTHHLPRSHSSGKIATVAIGVQPPSSSPPITPPRKSKRLSRPNTPLASPSGYKELFAAVSPHKDYFDPPSAPSSPGTTGQQLGRTTVVRPGGMRRMLTKTQSMGGVPTLPSETDEKLASPGGTFGANLSPSSTTSQPTTPSRKLLRTLSMPESPLRSPLTDTGDPARSAQSQAQSRGPEQGQGSGGRAKRTYGGTRTMLAEVSRVELEISGMDSGTIDDRDEEMAPQESYAQLREKFEVDNTSIERTGSGSGNLMAELLLARAPQTVSDMRSKGENRRFMDELNYLIDGLADPSSGVAYKRTSCMEVLRNMMDDSWLAKMKVCGQVERVWEAVNGCKGDPVDEVITAICLVYLSILLQSGFGLEQLVQGDPAIVKNPLLSCLRTRDGPLDGTNKWIMVKASHKVRGFASQLKLQWIYEEPGTRRIASSLLQAVYEQDSEIIKTLVPDAKAVGKIINALRAEVQPLVDRFDLYEKGLDMSLDDDPPDFDHMLNLMRIVWILVGRSEYQLDLSLELPSISETLVDVILCASTLVWTGAEGVKSGVFQCAIKALELLTYFAQESPESAMSIASVSGAATSFIRLLLHGDTSETSNADEAEESMQTEVDEDAKGPKPKEGVLSRQGLTFITLALITALAMAGSETASRVGSTAVDRRCLGKHACLKTCRCLSAQPLLSHLNDIYVERCHDTDDPDCRVLAGHLALLIATLLPDYPSAEEVDRTSSQGLSRRRLPELLGSLKALKYEVHQTIERVAKRLESDSHQAPKGDRGEELEGVDTAHVDAAILKLEKWIAYV
ncbi:hypothetical protein IAU60_003974 [Kwoniella sp. DSM 27419]